MVKATWLNWWEWERNGECGLIEIRQFNVHTILFWATKLIMKYSSNLCLASLWLWTRPREQDGKMEWHATGSSGCCGEHKLSVKWLHSTLGLAVIEATLRPTNVIEKIRGGAHELFTWKSCLNPRKAMKDKVMGLLLYLLLEENARWWREVDGEEWVDQGVMEWFLQKAEKGRRVGVMRERHD